MSLEHAEERHEQGKEIETEECSKISANTCQLFGVNDNIKHIAKVDYSSTLFSVSGEKLQSKAAAECAVTWRSHHAFSARCAHYLLSTLRAQHCKEKEEEEEKANVCDEDEKPYINNENDKVNATGKCWRIGFYLKATSTEPHILLSVAPRYCTLTPSSANAEQTCSSTNSNTSNLLPTSDEEKEMCDKRILETPLIWEEPYALSIECTQCGCFVWSDHWGMFNKPLKSITENEYKQRHAQQDKIHVVDKSKNDNSNNCDTQEAVRMEEKTKKSEEDSKIFERLVEIRWNQPSSDTLHNYAKENKDFISATLSVNVYEPMLPLTNTCSLSSSFDISNLSNAITLSQAKLRYADELTLPVDLHSSSMLEFTPYVTLLEAGDEATIIDTT